MKKRTAEWFLSTTKLHIADMYRNHTIHKKLATVLNHIAKNTLLTNHTMYTKHSLLHAVLTKNHAEAMHAHNHAMHANQHATHAVAAVNQQK